MKLKSIAVGLVALVAVGPTGFTRAESIGGPCNGESSPSRRIEAHVVGRDSRNGMKIVLHVESDQSGSVAGKLIFERGGLRFSIADWCRLWVGGERSGASHEGVVHVLGTQKLSDGASRLIRIDVMSGEGGRVRVRSRSGGTHESLAASESEHGWTSLTGEGWLQLTRLRMQGFLS